MNIPQQVFSGLRWMALGRFAGQLAAWVITIYVMRILSPSDYGLMAMAMIIIGLADLLRELGLTAALIQQPELNRDVAGRTLGAVMLLNIVLYVVLYSAAPAVSIMFEEPQLTQLIRVLGLQFPLMTLGVIPLTVLSRKMAFKEKSIVDLAGVLSSSLSTLTFVLAGFGVWALVWGEISGMLVRLLGANVVARYWCMPRLSFAGLGSILKFGGYVTATRLVWYFYTQVDRLIIGKLLGSEALGVYSVAAHLATMPMQKLGGILAEVGFSGFSRIHHSQQLVSKYYAKASRVVGALSFPIFWGLSSVAEPAVAFLLGEKWAAAVLPLVVLSLIAPLQMLSSVNAPALMGSGNARLTLANVLIPAAIMPAAFVVASPWGIAGICLAWALAYPISFVLMQRRVLRALGLSFGAYASALRTPVVAATVMYVVVTALQKGLEAVTAPAPLGLSVMVAAGAAVYATMIVRVDRGLLAEVGSLFRA